MGEIASTTPVKLFVATLHSATASIDNAAEEWKARYGNFDFVSEDFPFSVTDYYEKEMGTKLVRRFYSVEALIAPESIVEAKLFSNEIEARYRGESGRTINLDPGYLDYYKVVLASTKYGGQKIPMRDGIYADMTLVRYKGKWDSFAWGFPDFKSGLYDAVLTRIRELYKAQVSGSV